MTDLRILYIDASVGFGGAVKSLALTLRGLPGIDKRILTSQNPDIVRTWFPTLEVTLFRRVINYRLNQRLYDSFDKPVLKWLATKVFATADIVETARNTLRICALIRRKRINLIHLNNGFLPHEVMLAAELTRVPCIVHVRGFQGDEIHPRWARSVVRVIAVSDAVAESLRSCPIPSSLVTTIYDPVDSTLVSSARTARDSIRNQWKIVADDVVVGIFGRVIPWKGQREFAHATVAAMKENPRLKAFIVGDESDGNPSYFDSIKAYIRDAGMTNRFVFTGYRENVEEYYAAVDIVVHASVTPEPFGMVVPEAMAAERPVIASNSGGPKEVVEDGVDGILVAPGNVEELTKAILCLAGDDALRARLAAAGLEKSDRFGIEANAGQVAAVYQRVIQQAQVRS